MMSEIAPRTRRKALRGRLENLSKTYLIAITSDALPPLSPRELLKRLLLLSCGSLTMAMAIAVQAFRERQRLRRLFQVGLLKGERAG